MNNFFIVPLFAKIKFAKGIIAPEGSKNSMQLTSPLAARHNGSVVINVVGRQWNILTMWVRVQSPLFREIQQDTRRNQARNYWWSLTRLGSGFDVGKWSVSLYITSNACDVYDKCKVTFYSFKALNSLTADWKLAVQIVIILNEEIIS